MSWLISRCTECRGWILPWHHMGFRLTGVRRVTFHTVCVGWSA